MIASAFDSIIGNRLSTKDPEVVEQERIAREAGQKLLDEKKVRVHQQLRDIEARNTLSAALEMMGKEETSLINSGVLKERRLAVVNERLAEVEALKVELKQLTSEIPSLVKKLEKLQADMRVKWNEYLGLPGVKGGQRL